MYMYELSGFFFIIERRRERERELEWEIFNDVCCVDFVWGNGGFWLCI